MNILTDFKKITITITSFIKRFRCSFLSKMEKPQYLFVSFKWILSSRFKGKVLLSSEATFKYFEKKKITLILQKLFFVKVQKKSHDFILCSQTPPFYCSFNSISSFTLSLEYRLKSNQLRPLNI